MLSPYFQLHHGFITNSQLPSTSHHSRNLITKLKPVNVIAVLSATQPSHVFTTNRTATGPAGSTNSQLPPTSHHSANSITKLRPVSVIAVLSASPQPHH